MTDKNMTNDQLHNAWWEDANGLDYTSELARRAHNGDIAAAIMYHAFYTQSSIESLAPYIKELEESLGSSLAVL